MFIVWSLFDSFVGVTGQRIFAKKIICCIYLTIQIMLTILQTIVKSLKIILYRKNLI